MTRSIIASGSSSENTIHSDRIAREHFDERFGYEALPLFRRHWLELANYREQRPLAPDLRKYEELDRKRVMRWFTIRREGELLGYAAYLVSPTHLHYRGWACAMADTFWIAPEYGARAWGYVKLFRFANNHLEARGCRWITYHARRHQRDRTDVRMGPIFKRLDYGETETLYEKFLG